MAIHNQIKYARVRDLFLDPYNTRLGRENTGPDVRQPKILELMMGWSLEDLAISFIESNFWPQEALITVKEKLYGKTSLVVVEGNRRLAALKLLEAATKGEKLPRRWAELVKGAKVSKELFESVPYIEADSREDVESFLGFRHVTGILEWRPAEKAEYIAKLIEKRHMTYEEVMRKIGSKTPAVRQHYISYRLLVQMEDQGEISTEKIEDKFSVLFLSLRTQGVQKYLQIDVYGEPDKVRRPVPKSHLKNLANFALWLFGDKTHDPIVRDSRQIDQFGRVLESRKAVEYLVSSKRPVFEMAVQLAGGDEPEVIRFVEEAAESLELALSKAHHYARSRKLRAAAARLARDTFQLVSIFPGLKDELDELAERQ
jgi:hypothetical protein